MRQFLLAIFAASCLLLSSQSARADLSLTLNTTAPGLNNLMAGQPIAFRVDLAGIDGTSDNVDFLAATVAFDGSLLEGTTIFAGGIVPDHAAFQSAIASGLADANYDALFANAQTPISTNGTFFTFQILPLKPGSGEMKLSFVSAMRGTNVLPVVVGPALQFRVIPEPAAGMLAVLGLFAPCMLPRKVTRGNAS